MSKRKKTYYSGLAELLKSYAEKRTFDYHRYSEYHMRIIDSGFTVVDCWTSGKYWIKQTEYFQQTDKDIIERAGETGLLPLGEKQLFEFLDKIFFAAALLENS